MSTLGRALGTALTVVVLVVAGVAAWTWLAPDRGEARSHTYRQPVTSVHLDNDDGDITVHAGPPGAVTVASRLSWTTLGRPTTEESWDGDTLTIAGRCPRTHPGSACVVDYVLVVPPGVALDLRTGAGAVRARDLTGDVRLAAAAGDVTADDVTGPLRVRADTGRVTGSGLRSDAVDIEIGSGDVALTFAEPPATATAVAGHGDVVVGLPAGAYDVAADAASGDDTVEVRQDPAAPSRVTARTGAGDVHVRYAG